MIDGEVGVQQQGPLLPAVQKGILVGEGYSLDNVDTLKSGSYRASGRSAVMNGFVPCSHCGRTVVMLRGVVDCPYCIRTYKSIDRNKASGSSGVNLVSTETMYPRSSSLGQHEAV